MAHDPVVFISSTSDDLKEHREQAAKAASASGFSPRMMEYFPASGHTPTLEACLEKVTEAEVVVVLGQVGDPRLEEDNWVTIPAGTFQMGAQKQNKNGQNYDPEVYDDQAPVHDVTLSLFRIRRFPITVQEFDWFIKKGGYSARKYWAEGYGKFEEPEDWERQKQYPNRSVVGVSWFEAAAYCSWAGVRLPTEAEWERAARGPEGTRYPWGNEPPLDASRANYDISIGHPTPVGLFPNGSTSEGLCDMLGNVWEWCGDWFGLYKTGSQENPAGPKEGDSKVLRGGAWNNIPQSVRVSNRLRFEPTFRYVLIGFRCVGE